MNIRTLKCCSLAHRLLALCLVGTGTFLHAQALPASGRGSSLSAFGMVSGVKLPLKSITVPEGKNLSITVGADLNLRRTFSLYPSVEVRATYPMDKGKFVSQQNVLGGLKLAKYFGRIQPYATALAGFGKLDYGSGMLSPDFLNFYTDSTSFVLSPGAGIDVRATSKFDVKVDAQFQHYKCPVCTSDELWAKSYSVGVGYRF